MQAIDPNYTQPSTRKPSFTKREFEDKEYSRLQKLLIKKIEASGVHVPRSIEHIPPLIVNKVKRGLMDNIGEIFEEDVFAPKYRRHIIEINY